ncbi:MAG: hypothetical protein M3P44_00345 [Actinomycetota bacterium]|nr:hypothetical protein [Actinomycetota bacterium]
MIARLRPILVSGAPSDNRQGDRREHGGSPRAEVLGRDVLAGGVLQPGVDVRRADVLPRAPALVGQQLLPAAAAALETAHDVGDLGIDHRLHAALAVLGGVVEQQHLVP